MSLPGPDVKTNQLGEFSQVDRSDSEDFVQRLDEMHALDSFQAYKKQSFDLLDLVAGASVADVGCGTGGDASKLADRVAPGGCVVGFDLSEAMLAQARSRHANNPAITFQAAGSDQLMVEDGRFDAVRADRVLIHVPDPVRTLAEMIRVAKPGGRVVVSEPDMPGCWVGSDDDAIAGLVMNRIAGSCAAPFLPRNLWSRFKEAGLKDVALVVSPVTAFDPAAVDKILGMSGIVASLVLDGELDGAAADDWLDGLLDRGRAGRFVAGLSIMTVAGTKR